MNSLTILQSLSDAGLTASALHRSTLESFGSFLVLVLAWSLVRPNMIRDYDNRALPYNATARIAFTLACAIAYLSLAFGYLAFIGAAERVMSVVPHAEPVLRAFRGQPAMLAVVTLGGMLQLTLFRELERSTIIWLHSRKHMTDDVIKLGRHLEAGPFTPSIAERQLNREYIKRYGIYVTDESVDGVGLVTFNKWRKTSALLRLVKHWNAEDAARALGDDEMRQLRVIETSHDRKTELAMTILKMVDEVQETHGGDVERALGASLKVLSDAPHIDRESVAKAETRAQTILAGSGVVEDMSKKQLRLTAEQLRNRLGQIERYFEVEYQILLNQLSMLAARSVVLAAEKANDRIDQLKTAGVGGLGSIQQFNLDRVIWMFLVVAFGGFLIMYLGYSRTMTPQLAEGLARFTFAMAVAALLGAIIGSRRRHARTEATPWLKYLLGGLLAGFIFLALSAMSNAVKVAMGVPPAPDQPPFSLYRMLPWALLPCLTTIAIARLARMSRWTRVRRLEPYRLLYVRTADGVCVSIALLVAYCIAFSLHPLLGIELSPALKQMAAESMLPIPLNWTVQSLGFLIGFTVVRDVRWAAHSTIIETTGQEPMVEIAPATEQSLPNVAEVARPSKAA